MKLLSPSGIRAGQEGGGSGVRTEAPAVSAALGGSLRVPGPEDHCWDHAEWLDDLRELPAEATWPRLMTLPHPNAVGTYGLEVEAQFRRRMGREPRWFQRLFWRRVLEHDEHGRLVWLIYLLSMARQLGKSWALREKMLWRLDQTERWGDQLIVHTGKDVPIVQEVMLPVMNWADRPERKRAGWRVDWTNGKWALGHTIEPASEPCPDCGGRLLEDGAAVCVRCRGAGQLRPDVASSQARWLSRSFRQVYGYSATAPEVDEAWKVPPGAVNDGLYPTMVEQTSPQLGLTSTAHPQATGLMLDRRVTALGQLFEPENILLLEWSAPTPPAGRGDGPDLDDQRNWRAASPHWSAQRRELIAGALQAARDGGSDPEDPDPIGSFRCQWLNQWPHDAETREDPDERVATAEQWDACLDEDAAPAAEKLLVLAVEDDLGRGAAAAAASLTVDGRVVLGGHRFETLREAVDWAEDTAEALEDAGMDADTLLLVGASVLEDPELEDLELVTEPVGSRETRLALPTLRQLARAGKLAHDGGEDVTASVLGARVPPNVTGESMLVRVDALARCVAWAVHRAHRDRW
jgi:hypothetical protein